MPAHPHAKQSGSAQYVFASYSHKDSTAVLRELDAIGRLIPVWFDHDIRPGHRWNDELAAAVADCVAFVLFVTPSSTVSPNCLRELQFALDEGKPLVAIHLETTPLSPGMRLAIGDRQAILKYALEPGDYAARLHETFTRLAASAVHPEPGVREYGRAVVIDRPSIAVLPFKVLNADADAEAFAVGMSDDLTMLLARVPEFFVVSRQSAAAAPATDLATIGRQLRVRYLVTGTVRTAAARLRVSAQLVDAADGVTLWANVFDRDRTDVFALQDELARRIAGELRPELVIADLNYGRVTGNYTSWRRIASAMVQYGHGPSPQNIDELAVLVEDTLADDPEYAPAHALHAFTIARRRNWGDLDDAAIARAEKSAKTALAIAPNDPLVLYFLAGVEQALGRRRNGERLALQAADREPSNAAFQATAGFILTLGGKLTQGIERLSLATELSPSDPMRGQYLFQLGAALFLARRFDEARIVLDESLCLQPDTVWTWLVLAGACEHLGDIQAAAQAITRIKGLSGWGTAEFEALLARILADAWEDGSDIRTLWMDTLARLARAGL